MAELADRAILLDHGHVVQDGEPNDAIAAFRDLLENQRQDDMKAAPVNPELENGRVRRAGIAGAGTNRNPTFRSGEDIEIIAEFEHTTGIDRWICAVQVDNAMGQKVYGTATDRAVLDLGRLEGSRTIALTIRNPMFGGGKYFVNISLMDFAGRHLHDLPQACTFNILDHEDATGSVYARPAFRELTTS